jgi:hypothetical protein
MRLLAKLSLMTIVICLVISCTPYKITTPLDAPLKPSPTCAIGEITDDLPLDMDLEAKPTLEEIAILKDELDKQLENNKTFEMLGFSAHTMYEVSGSLIDFKRGSGVARFFIGFGVGNAKITAALRLVDKADNNKVVFAGNFSATIANWSVKGSEMYKIIAKNFAKAIKKEIKRIDKEAK